MSALDLCGGCATVRFMENVKRNRASVFLVCCHLLVFALMGQRSIAQDLPCATGPTNIVDSAQVLLPFTIMTASIVCLLADPGVCPDQPCTFKFEVSVEVWHNPGLPQPQFELCFQDQTGSNVCFPTYLSINPAKIAFTYELGPQVVLFEQKCGTSTQVRLYSDLGFGGHHMVASLTAMCWGC